MKKLLFHVCANDLQIEFQQKGGLVVIPKTKINSLIWMGIFVFMIAMGGCDKSSLKEEALNEQQKWALATSAIPKKANDMEMGVMGGGKASDEYVNLIREMLKEDWEITDRNSALSAISSLRDQGHRKDFDLMLKHVLQLDQQEFSQFYNSCTGQPEMKKLLAGSYKTKDIAEIGRKSIIGWDYCRLVYLAECSYRAGYISEEEAWKEIMPAAKVIQSTFSSWQEMSENYLLGREFWSGGSEPRMIMAKALLLSDRQSPWLRYAWNLPLDQTAGK